MKVSLLLIIIGLSLQLVGCASSTKNGSSPTIGPGAAMVSALVLGYSEQDDSFVCTLKILQVHGYGASTPPLPVDTEINVLMRRTLFGEDVDGTNAAERLQNGREMDVTLKHQQVPAGVSAPSWTAVELH